MHEGGAYVDIGFHLLADQHTPGARLRIWTSPVRRSDRVRRNGDHRKPSYRDVLEVPVDPEAFLPVVGPSRSDRLGVYESRQPARSPVWATVLDRAAGRSPREASTPSSTTGRRQRKGRPGPRGHPLRQRLHHRGARR